MPDPSFFDAIFKAWPAGAAAAGIVLLAWFLFKYIATPFMDRMDTRRAADRQSQESEIKARVKIAEAQQATSLLMKETLEMAARMHERCHHFQRRLDEDDRHHEDEEERR